nr:probable LRR receptor-like serine/threonine-protein kinase At3g47570 [Ipomoea trifida]
MSPSLSKLYLGANQFTGTIPSTISNATQLIELDLGLNMFSGHIPLMVANLHQLEYFSIEYNQITNDPSAHELSLLTSLSKCKNLRQIVLNGNPFNTFLPSLLDLGNKSLPLEYLYASECHLKGSIPSGISNFSNLVSLELNDNKLSGSFPETLGHLLRSFPYSFLHCLWCFQFSLVLCDFEQYLANSNAFNHSGQSLDLSSNNLTGKIPATMYNVSSLQFVDLRNNHLSGTLPEGICDNYFRQLQGLYLSANRLSGEIPSSLPKCMDLRFLNLGYNEFHGSIPPEIGNFSKLEWLMLYGNNLTGDLPWTIFNISSLVKLNIRTNEISGILPNDLCYQIPELEYLDISENQIHGEIPQVLSNCRRLQVLSMSNNQLSGRFPTQICNISSLQELYFIGMNLTGLRHWISPSLKGLLLAGNRFSGTIPSTISNASQLIMLDLGNNMFSGHVPLVVENLHQLQFFAIEYNHITNDPSANELSLLTSLSKCKNLKMVILEGNPFNTVLPDSLDAGNMSSSLKYLYAADCHFKGSIPSGISNFSNLISLDLAKNNLSGSLPRTLGHLLRKLITKQKLLQSAGVEISVSKALSPS